MCVSSCEKYQVAGENSPFRLRASFSQAVAGMSVELSLFVAEGTSEGDCSLKSTITDLADGSTPSYSVLLNGTSSINELSNWKFDDRGVAKFTITGLPAGTYAFSFDVSRWYHTATVTGELTINP